MSRDWCGECASFHVRGDHKPLFEVVEEPDGLDEGGRRIRAWNAAEAVEAWADLEDYNGNEYDIVGGRHEPIVLVRDADGKVTRWRVTGEAVRSYRATAIEEAST